MDRVNINRAGPVPEIGLRNTSTQAPDKRENYPGEIKENSNLVSKLHHTLLNVIAAKKKYIFFFFVWDGSLSLS